VSNAHPRVEIYGAVQALPGQLVAAVPEIAGAVLEILLRCIVVITLRGPDAGGRGDAAGDQHAQRGGGERQPRKVAPRCNHTVTILLFLSPSLTRTRSLTLPANCPQAASISSPRVLGVVAMPPCSLTRPWKRWSASAEERRNSLPGNGLKGIRFTFAGRSSNSPASRSAQAGESLTPFSMTYSKVMNR